MKEEEEQEEEIEALLVVLTTDSFAQRKITTMGRAILDPDNDVDDHMDAMEDYRFPGT